MNRIPALMLLLVALLNGATDPMPKSAAKQAVPDLAVSWKASVDAETAKDYDEALHQLRLYLTSGGDKFMATLRAGWLMYSKGDYTSAALNYANASRMEPAAITPVLGSLYTAIAVGDRVKVIQAAENVLRLEPTNYKAEVAIAEVYYSAGDYRRSRSAYRRVLAIYPDDQYAMNGAAWSALLIGEKAEAVDGFKKLLSVNAEYANASDGLARATGRQALSLSLTSALPR
jgi:tetratricopeptide (TPR) repeat protein